MSGVTKFDRIKNLATFSDFSWSAALPPFKQFNLVFGWNGTGKTALSRLFESLESGQHKEFPALEYQVTLDDAKYKNGESIPRKVRVFNIDYVARNVGIVAEGASPIYVLGEKSQEILAAIKKDEIALNGIAGDESKPGLVELRRRATEAQRQITREREGEQPKTGLSSAFDNFLVRHTCSCGRG